MSNRAIVTINSEEDRHLVQAWAKNVAVGTIVEFRKKTRSHDQNAKLHAMLDEVSEQVIWYGRQLDVDDWKNLFTASLRHADVVPGIDRGTIVPLGMKTSSMTIEEMSNLIELIYAFGADPAHPVNFKEPQTSDESPPSSGAGVDAPHHGVDSDNPAQADKPGEELDPPASSSPGSTLSDEDKDNLLALILRLKASIGPDETVVKLTGRSFAAEGRTMSELAGKKANKLVDLFRAVCRGERDKTEVIREACGIAQVDELELGMNL